MDIDEFDVDRAHRTGSAYRDHDGKWHVRIIVRFTSWYARNAFYVARKSSIAFVTADITNRRKDLLNDAKELARIEGSRPANFIDFVFIDRNCHLSIKTKDERFFKFNSLDEFHSLVNYIEETQAPNLDAWKYHDKKKEPIIVDLHTVGNVREWMDDKDHVYVGRKVGSWLEGSQWGNPFNPKEHGLETCLRLYEEHIMTSPELSSALGSLKEKNLGCWCLDSNMCHANTLLKLIGN